MADDIKPYLGHDHAAGVAHQTPPMGQEEAVAPGRRPRAITRRTNATEDIAARLGAMLDVLEQTQGAVAALVSSQRARVLNGVLFAGTLPFDSSGVVTREHRLQCGSLLVINNTAAAFTVQPGPAGGGASTQGVGVHIIPAGSFLPVAIGSHAWTIYGAAGTLVDVTAFVGLEAFGSL